MGEFCIAILFFNLQDRLLGKTWPVFSYDINFFFFFQETAVEEAHWGPPESDLQTWCWTVMVSQATSHLAAWRICHLLLYSRRRRLRCSALLLPCLKVTLLLFAWSPAVTQVQLRSGSPLLFVQRHPYQLKRLFSPFKHFPNTQFFLFFQELNCISSLIWHLFAKTYRNIFDFTLNFDWGDWEVCYPEFVIKDMNMIFNLELKIFYASQRWRIAKSDSDSGEKIITFLQLDFARKLS